MRRPIADVIWILAFAMDHKFANAFSFTKSYVAVEAHGMSGTSPTGPVSLLSTMRIRDTRQHAVCMAAKAPAFKGFGKVPEGPFNRMPQSGDDLCVCESGKAYKDCCQPFHTEKEWPSTPEQLMRSRFGRPSSHLIRVILVLKRDVHAINRSNCDFLFRIPDA